ncbi:hypothetical protein [Spirosoma sordidisoli]|uniref:Uncharacterized protein n=1 Tax=Spirosoma sordidisoli TaxID=2502893 RepID=A0A4Q2USC9_9BACT|nr:hypothetical protein [Spirosoma sordidisoli]RYC70655.1 hypothetical protein EQG79_00450 [Spirosoma sordidisoli]
MSCYNPYELLGQLSPEQLQGLGIEGLGDTVHLTPPSSCGCGPTSPPPVTGYPSYQAPNLSGIELRRQGDELQYRVTTASVWTSLGTISNNPIQDVDYIEIFENELSK